MNEEFYISLIGEAFDGYTEATLDDRLVYVRHINIRDQRYLHKYYDRYKNIALSKGVESKEEREERVIKDGIWTREEDQKIASLVFEIENLKKTIKGRFLPSQKEDTTKRLNEVREELADLLTKRQ